MEYTAQELTVAGALLLVIGLLVNGGVKVMLAKLGVADPKQPTVCLDPITKNRVREIHDYTEGVQRQIAAGDFKCAWEGRDEIRDLMEIMRQNVAATEALTHELRLTRNGKR